MTRMRQQISVRGQVQGVGFRPFVYRLAAELSLAGSVRNDSRGAWIEIEGEPAVLESFCRRLRSECPPLARIYEMDRRTVPLTGETVFAIVGTQAGHRQDVGITPDAAVCGDCLRELFDPADRRYRYPFINCTNCGPRYSIIETVPYDRPNTTMRVFQMCEACRREYDNPADRRFHAQPNACSVCGPRVWLTDSVGQMLDGDPIAHAAEMLRNGRIVAIKGIGGFHLACRADRDEPVQLLRQRKGRDTKPFAVMAANLETARKLGEIDEQAESWLTSVERPIVLVRPKSTAGPGENHPPESPLGKGGPGICPDAEIMLSRYVAFDTPSVGLLLPYAPLQHLLFAEKPGPLVMTSGNPSNEPLTCDNDEALRRLGNLADAFLMHDRDIRRRVDDSVVIASSVGVTPIRRARGFAPSAVVMPKPTSRPVLAVGGELKNTICLYSGQDAVLSEHLGDLKSPETYRHFLGTIDKFAELLRVRPECIAYDLHPAYLSTQYARQQHVPLFAVQHHHAHIVSCMAEHGTYDPVIGVSCDGTGYGDDGAIWGCEILRADAASYRRLAHLRYFALPGGDAAAEQTFRSARAVLDQIDRPLAEGFLSGMKSPDRLASRGMVEQLLRSGVNCPLTSSLGRLFDAVAWIIGVCDENGHEAQAAMALEERADALLRTGKVPVEPYPFELTDADGMLELDWRPMVTSVVHDVCAGRDACEIAAGFHETLAHMLSSAAVMEAEKEGLHTVGLSGGCFANQILLRRTVSLLSERGLTVLTHRCVPCGDGGLALGQAVSAAARMEM